MFIVWALLGALVAWPVLGASIGIAAALWKGFPVPGGILLGVILGPLAFALFLVKAEDMSCIVCGYEWQFESPHLDPDKPPIRES